MRRGLLRVAGAGVAPLALAVALTAGTAWASAPEPTVPEPAPSAPATEPDVTGPDVTEPDVTEPAATEPTTTAATAPVSTMPPEPTVPETQPATTVATDQECVDGETSASGGHAIACVGGVWVAIADPPAPPAPADTTPVDTGVVDGVEVAIIDAPLPPPIPAAPSRPTTTLPRPAPPMTPVGQVAVEIAVVDLVLAAWG